MKRITRRSFLAGTAAAALLSDCSPPPLPRTRYTDPKLAGEVGLVAATFASHQPHRAGEKATIQFLDIPRILRDELDMKVLDSNSVADLITAADRDLTASPDTGNWDSNEIRYRKSRKNLPPRRLRLIWAKK